MALVRLPGVFQPVSDADALIDALRDEPLTAASEAVDLCTGTGIVAVEAARLGAQVTAVDISRRALLCARINATLAGVRIRARRGDLFAPIEGRRVDVISANPPYLPAEDDETAALPLRGPARAWEGGEDGRVLIDRICAQARDHLRPGGALLLVHSSIIGISPTLEAMRAGGLTPTVVARRRGSVGPLVRARADALRARGFLPPGEDDEEIVVVRGQARAVRVAPQARSAMAS